MLCSQYSTRLLPDPDYFRLYLQGFLDEGLAAPAPENTIPFNLDLRENENEYIIDADMPGIRKEDILVQYDNQCLNISAQRSNPPESENESYVRSERKHGKFLRSLRIDNVMEYKIGAKFSDGVLTVILPKQVKGQKQPGAIPVY